jgi:F0F1-type ATP synthase assembly protein I
MSGPARRLGRFLGQWLLWSVLIGGIVVGAVLLVVGVVALALSVNAHPWLLIVLGVLGLAAIPAWQCSADERD